MPYDRIFIGQKTLRETEALRSVKTFLSLFALIGLLVCLTGCPKIVDKAEVHSKGYFTFFDTVSYIYSYNGESADEFDENCRNMARIFDEYHKMLDIRAEYDGMANLCTLNKNAGGDMMVLDKRLIDFLIYAKQLHTLTNGEMNVMMGAVLTPWHELRTKAGEDAQNARIPNIEELKELSLLTDISFLEIDKENLSARISKEGASIDVGAIGKGYATEMAALYLEEKGIAGYVLDVGGNIVAVGTKPSGEGWSTGIKDPQKQNDFAKKIIISDTSCVTSGSYERFFTVGGKNYHHVIDKDTLMPSAYFSSVTVVCKSSALADALSTALFCMSIEDGKALLEKADAEAYWIDNGGNEYMTDGFKALVSK